jgi:hypothetical protein
LEYYGELTVTYPKIEEQWNIISDINGKIKNLKNGREYAYLYYEGIPTNNKFDLDKGFVISKDSVPKFLERKLDEIGFNYQESNDLIAYWLPELTKDKFVAIKFLFNEECDKYSRLTISPNPESEFRLMIEFINLNSKIDLKRQRMIKLDRKPYTVVEWGGINYTN